MRSCRGEQEPDDSRVSRSRGGGQRRLAGVGLRMGSAPAAISMRANSRRPRRAAQTRAVAPNGSALSITPLAAIATGLRQPRPVIARQSIAIGLAAPIAALIVDSRFVGRGGINAGWASLFLLLVPLLPDLAAGGVEAEQDLEFGVGLLGIAGPQVALDQQRPGIEQLGVEPDRLAASRDGRGPIAGLAADLGQCQAIVRAPGIDRDRLPRWPSGPGPAAGGGPAAAAGRRRASSRPVEAEDPSKRADGVLADAPASPGRCPRNSRADRSSGRSRMAASSKGMALRRGDLRQPGRAAMRRAAQP